MKPTKERGIAVEGNLTGDEARMTIDPTAMQHIMAILTDLYSDPEYAVLREYSTNAWDAHQEAGVKQPIEVFLPTSLSPYLRVRDYGIGLTVDDIHRIYSQYGASTKRGTDEQTGMLGLGCKSALTYASQFTVEARKDGEQIAVAVSRSDDGGGTMTIVDRRTTAEPNGVEVRVPVRKGHTFQEKANNLFRFWPENAVLVNGAAPPRFEGLQISKNLFIVKDGSRNRYYTDEGHHTCVMGNVPYPMQIDGLTELPYNVDLIAFVPIGAVNFTPSREALHYTNHTKATLAKIVEDFRAEVPNAVQRAVEKAKTHAEALATVAEWDYLLKTGQVFDYKGDKLPSAYTIPHPMGGTDSGGDPAKLPVRTTGNQGYGRLSGYTSSYDWPARNWPSTVWVENFEPSDVTADHKRKLQKWTTDQGLEGINAFVLLYGNVEPSKFIDPKQVVDYKTVIRPMKLATATVGSSYNPKLPGSYWCWTEDHIDEYKALEIQGDDIRRDELIVWIQGNKWSGRTYAQQLKLHYDKFTVVSMPANRIAKFQRIVPEAMKHEEALEAKRDEWLTKLTDDQRLALAIHEAGEGERLRKYDGMKLHDPDLTEAVRLSKLPGIAKLAEQYHSFHMLDGLPKWENPMSRYPLLSTHRYYSPTTNKQHKAIYMNAIYDQEVK